jgi:hypothetical protein
MHNNLIIVLTILVALIPAGAKTASHLLTLKDFSDAMVLLPAAGSRGASGSGFMGSN